VPHDLTDFVVIYLVDPFVADGSVASGEGGELPSSVIFYRLHFLHHGLAPRFLVLCLTK
jgi:hypothetical protein